jgi:hypothetical protein
MDLICYGSDSDTEADSGLSDGSTKDCSEKATQAVVHEKASQVASTLQGISTSADSQHEKPVFTFNERYPFLSDLPPEIYADDKPHGGVSQYIDNGVDLAAAMQASRVFKNPYILTRIVEQLGIDESGTAYPRHLFCPGDYQGSDFEDEVKARYGRAGSSAAPWSNNTDIGAGQSSLAHANVAQPSAAQSSVKSSAKRSRWDMA